MVIDFACFHRADGNQHLLTDCSLRCFLFIKSSLFSRNQINRYRKALKQVGRFIWRACFVLTASRDHDGKRSRETINSDSNDIVLHSDLEARFITRLHSVFMSY